MEGFWPSNFIGAAVDLLPFPEAQNEVFVVLYHHHGSAIGKEKAENKCVCACKFSAFVKPLLNHN